MYWDDILDDNKNTLNQNYSMDCDELLKLRQALLSKKKDKDTTAFSINREYVNSSEFHAKFEKLSELSVNKNVQESLYKESGRLLEFIDKLEIEQQSQERLLAIDAKTGKFIVDNFSRNGETYRTSFNDDEYQKIEDCENQIILVHNHSLNGQPSARDLLTCLHNDKVAMSVIVCHNGDVYAVSDVKPVFEEEYTKRLETCKLDTTNIDEAKQRAIDLVYEDNSNLSKRHKMFNMIKL